MVHGAELHGACALLHCYTAMKQCAHGRHLNPPKRVCLQQLLRDGAVGGCRAVQIDAVPDLRSRDGWGVCGCVSGCVGEGEGRGTLPPPLTLHRPSGTNEGYDHAQQAATNKNTEEDPNGSFDAKMATPQASCAPA
jgi:hypothetical protein